MDELTWLVNAIGWLGIAAIVILVVMFIQDISQKDHAVRRNFPIVGRMRYFLERQGEFFRQYFFAMDREEMPFNRATRNWIYRTAKGLGGMVGFGSTNDLREPGTILFVNSPYPPLEEYTEPAPSCIIGSGCVKPFEAKNIFNISGMSFGAISKPAVRALSKGAAEANVWINTGEGGLSSYHLEGGGDIIFQIGTAKYGVRDGGGHLSRKKLTEVAGHENVRAFEIKLSQGAKPGKGGVLPAVKVTAEIAGIRGIAKGQISSSPGRHLEVNNPEDLLDMIERVREITGKPVGIKTVLGSDEYPRMLFEAIHQRGIDSAPDFITVDGGDGGTGAAPQILADHVGLPLSESLPILVDNLIEYDLRDRVKVIASGKLVTSARVAWAMCTGADFAVSARGFMFSLGCIQSLQCHMDTCPTGITTHNKRLQKGLVVENKAKRVAGYAHWMNVEADKIAHACGLAHAREFSRKHARIVTMPGKSMPLGIMYPYPVKRYQSSANESA